MFSQKVKNNMLRRMGITRNSFRGLTDGQKKRYFWWALICRPFTASSLRIFWTYWNPLYGYYLGQYIYKPLNRYFSHWFSMILTFGFCGFFLHDILGWPAEVLDKGFFLPPVTTWFLLISLGILITEGLGISFKGCNAFLKALIHISFLVGTHFIAMTLVRHSCLH